jgi:hypothetical protein
MAKQGVGTQVATPIHQIFRSHPPFIRYSGDTLLSSTTKMEQFPFYLDNEGEDDRTLADIFKIAKK